VDEKKGEKEKINRSSADIIISRKRMLNGDVGVQKQASCVMMGIGSSDDERPTTLNK